MKKRRKEHREEGGLGRQGIGRKKFWKIFPLHLLSLALSPCFVLLLSLSKKQRRRCHNSPSRPVKNFHRRPPIISPHQHHIPPLNPSNSSKISGEGRVDDSRGNSSPCNVNRHLPTSFPATSGHHFRRHHDQKNPLDILYTTVLTDKPFLELKNLVVYCSSSS